ncbi:hypothetical protein [Clostridium psychrophilum]|uniref:hypothetical protein n=1 Tax=Clostridium psychrophilum TaxID=132926 RepID=UPI001C0B8381|nr:hypothetical protein [Clostridium psychrophilum]MBU3180479.1 hypothetical protein [Clostridium psychrophilum]
MPEIEILKMLNLICLASIILLCLLIFAIAGAITYYLKSKKTQLKNLHEKNYKSLSNK